MTAQEADRVRANSHIYTRFDICDEAGQVVVRALAEGQVLSKRSSQESGMVYFNVMWPSIDGGTIEREVSAVNATVFLKGRNRG